MANDEKLEAVKLTGEMELKYVEDGGCRCLYCGEADIQGGSIDIECGAAYQKITCNVCGRDWVDSYKLVSVIE